jgi:hypothetical protein
MEFSYICNHTLCSYPGKDPFVMTLDGQSVMDDNNLATVFCPFCKKEMNITDPDMKASAPNEKKPGRTR